MNPNLESDLRDIIERASRTRVDVVHRSQADLTYRIPNNEDRLFAEYVIEELRNVEPNNKRVVVDIATNEPHFIYVWASGYQNSIDLTHFATVMHLEHPIHGFKGVSNVSIQPSTHGTQTKFIVKIARSAGVQSRQIVEWHEPPRRKAKKADYASPVKSKKKKKVSSSPNSSEGSSSSDGGMLGPIWKLLS